MSHDKQNCSDEREATHCRDIKMKRFIAWVFLVCSWTSVFGQVRDNRRSSGLAEIPNDISANVEELILRYNKITTIEKSKLSHLLALTQLDIFKNDVTVIETNAFENLIIRHLDLGKNPLKAFPDVTHLANTLEILKLFECSIPSAPKGLLDPLTLLTTLNLGKNKLTTWPNISHMLDLQTLLLPKNNIPNIPDGSFRQSSKLRLLDLAGNSLTRVPDLSGLVSLQQVTFDYNRFKDIPHHAFDDLHNITHISLTGMNLSTISNMHFHAVTDSLKILNIGNVNMRYITNEEVKLIQGLEELHLQNNMFASFDVMLLMKLPYLRVLSLSNNLLTYLNNPLPYKKSPTLLIKLDLNPLHCDARLCWMKRTNNGGGITLSLSAKPCSSPPALVGVNWMDINETMLQCNEIQYVKSTLASSGPKTDSGFFSKPVEPIPPGGGAIVFRPAAMLEACALWCLSDAKCSIFQFDVYTVNNECYYQT